MNRTSIRSLALALIVGAVAAAAVGCSTTRLLREPASVPSTGKAERTRSEDALDYSVAVAINAPADVVWGVLTDAPGYTRWNSTVLKLDGTVGAEKDLVLVAKVAPERSFPLRVSTFEKPTRMVWEDGNSMFLGVRTFTLRPDPSAVGGNGVVFTMQETFSGGMLGMIEGSLPDFTGDFEAFAHDVKAEAERVATSTYESTSPAAP